MKRLSGLFLSESNKSEKKGSRESDSDNWHRKRYDYL